jgi:hypothetical protein
MVSLPPAQQPKGKRQMKRYLPTCLLLCLSFSAYGGLHKWVDADGKVHYSDVPPPANVKAQELRVSAPGSGVPASKSIAERDAEYKKSQKAKKEAEEKSAKQQEAAAAKQRGCESAQQNLRALQDGGRMTTYNDKGERAFLDDKARQQRIEEMQKFISTNCN